MSLRTLIAAAPLLVVVSPLSAPIPAGSRACRDVRGTIEANVDRVRPALGGLRFDGAGTSHGDLEGAVAVRAIKRAFAKDLRLRLVITTSAGVVEVSGKATAQSSETAPDIRTIRGTWEVAGQTGEVRGEAGSVTGTGTADTRARSGRIEYSGRICAEIQEVDANPRVARQAVGKRLVIDA